MADKDQNDDVQTPSEDDVTGTPAPSSDPKPDEAPASLAELEDPEDVRLREAEAAAEAEEAAENAAAEGGEGEPKEPEPAKEPAKEPEKPQEAEQQQPKTDDQRPGPIPYERFAQVNAENQLYKDAFRSAGLLTEDGRFDFSRLQQLNQPQQQQEQEPQRDFQKEWSELDEQELALADQFDAGEINYGALKREEKKIQQQKARVQTDYQTAVQRRQEAERASQQQDQPPEQPQESRPQIGLADRQLMQQQIEHLKQEHPAVTAYEGKPEFRELQAMAEARASAAGRPYDLRNPEDVMRIRADVANLADQMVGTHFPDWQPSTDQQPAEEPKPDGPSDAARARERKYAAAETMPPDVGQMGQGGAPGAASITESKIEQMSPEERSEWMEKNPEEADRLLGLR